MLDIHVACEYARKWRYQLNSVNSLVMVMGESAVTRLRERLRRVWKLGNSIVCETDEQHHLRILRSSTVHRTNKRATAARSAFFALNVVGSRFGSLHPFTSLKLYCAICLPILLYGCEVGACSKTELLFLKRVHRKILHTIQGLPIRCPSPLTTMTGTQSIKNKVRQRMLGFVVFTTCLPAELLDHRILEVKAKTDHLRGVIKIYRDLLSSTSLILLLCFLVPLKYQPGNSM